jgi:hypothetical protein
MSVSRRRMFQTLAAGGLASADLRDVATAHGAALTEERLKILEPVLERRKRQLQALRDFKIDDSIAPTTGMPK